MEIRKLVALAFLSIALHAFGQENIKMMNTETEKQTLCFGRFLIDLPKDVLPIGQDDNYYSGFTVTQATKAQVKQNISDRIYQIDKNPTNAQPEHVIKTVSGAKPDSVIIVRRLIDTDLFGHEAGYNLEGYFWMSGNQYQFTGTSSANPKSLDYVIDSMLHVIAIAEPLRADEIPTTPGFCMGEVFFPGNNERGFVERTYRYYRLKNHPDVSLTISFRRNFSKIEKSLLTRIKESPTPSAWLPFLPRIKKIREGQHPVGNILAEESLESVPGGDDFQNHDFAWDTVGKPNDIYAPSMNIQLTSGDPPEHSNTHVRASVTDKEAVALFDSVVNSIRVRPVTGVSP